MEMMKKHEAQRRAEGTGDAGEEHRMQSHARKHSFNQASTGGDKHTVDTKLHIPPLAVLYTLF